MGLNNNNFLGFFERIFVSLSSKETQTIFNRDELPLSSELFSSDQLNHYGKVLASIHQVKLGYSKNCLLSRLAENESLLLKVYNLLTDDVRENRRITPAGEWILDNFYLIEEQIRTAKRHFPKGYSHELPHLLNGSSAGMPRVYDIALETISHGDGRVDLDNLSSFVTAYQSITKLKLGELWAIPIMLRLALMENLRRVTARIASDRIDRNCANDWADKMSETALKDPKGLVLVIADMARSNPPMGSSFVAELKRCLQGQGSTLALPLTWVEQHLSESGLSIEQMVRIENQQQASNQVSMSNSINSLRFLGAMDWSEFVEKMSYMEHILCKDPMGIYRKMDFITRDHYRHIIEKTAKKSSFSESEISLQALLLAQEAYNQYGVSDPKAHVGYYIIDQGLKKIQQFAKISLSPADILRSINRHFPSVYIGSIIIMTLLSSTFLVYKAYTDSLVGWKLLLFGFISIICASYLMVALANWFATLLATPFSLPRMDLSKGIPKEYRTLVVVPTMITSPKNIEELVKALEVRFLSNRDDNLHFGLLTDFGDASEQSLPSDKPLLDLIQQKIEDLNIKYHSQNNDIFYLFHRFREWNTSDKIWMGYERKRGKLADINKLIRTGSNESFERIVGNIAILTETKYIITLDTDTQLARDSASKFIGTMAHPLNVPHYDDKKQRVTSGYGILQPRVAISLSGANLSLYTRLWANDPGNDPYTRAISDVYQDMFGEGSFIGKGIYDIDAFEKALNGRFPENRILSHDLLEGCYARSGLLSDVPLYEEYPSSYLADVNRRHRWIRGDWQIAQWAFPVIPSSNAHFLKNYLSLLSKWKILDNLRRSLSSFALTLMMIFGWIFLESPLLWTLIVISIIVVPSLAISIISLFQKTVDVTFRQHLSATLTTIKKHLNQTVFTIACLPYEAYYSLDAIRISLGRMLFSHKHLLEWNPSNSQNLNYAANFIVTIKSMWIAPVLSLAILLILFVIKPLVLLVAIPVLFLWFLSPAIAWKISQPIIQHDANLSKEQILFLKKLARKTWAFFENFVGIEDNWLPPDNYQEYPLDVIAHRTSPTNMGLSLLANLTAYDFGYISAGLLLERTTKSINTMESLEKHHTHFYNWYDTKSLHPLVPFYISSVDSGNLAGHLLTLRPGLLSLINDSILSNNFYESLNITFTIFRDLADQVIPVYSSVSLDKLNLFFSSEFSAIDNPIDLKLFIEKISNLTTALVNSVENYDLKKNSQLTSWANALSAQCLDLLDELNYLIPWLPVIFSAKTTISIPQLYLIPTLNELAQMDSTILPLISLLLKDENNNNAQLSLLKDIQHSVIIGSQHAITRINTINDLANQCVSMANMDYEFLYDEKRHLLAIGYNVSESRLDSSYYDLLASEARFSSFIAIAQGKLPQESWFSLGRLLTTSGGEPILLSWSGSMFEYLMPLLVMPNYENTLLDQTYKAVVKRQIEYGKSRSVPWGISESGYNAIDVHQNYQYRAFGVPGLGLKRGLADDLVIAPYASVLALMIAPEEACLNLERLVAEGLDARFGLYEAIDYTSSRLPRGQSFAIVKSFMAHHQGMSLLSLSHFLLDHPMQKRFESDPYFQATILLLQERIPKANAFYARTTELSEKRLPYNNPETPIRIFTNPNTFNPEVQLLSNGKYHVMITNSGGGYSRWKDISLTRWKEDKTCDNWGMFCYLRDLETGEFWSTAYQPTLIRSSHFEAIFSEGRAEFRDRNNNFDTYTEIAVSPEDDVELRRIRITNRSRKSRVIDITSYAEVVLAHQVADAIHPAFSNLFIQTEIIPSQQAILCTRRPRSQNESEHWMLHLMTVQGAKVENVSYETDRMQFLGRGNNVNNPQVMNKNFNKNDSLSGSEGSVLDPIVAIRCKITLKEEESVTINIVTGISDSRSSALSLIEKYHDRHIADRVFDLTWTHGQVLLRQLNASEADAQLYGQLASSIIYANASLRADSGILMKNRRGQSGLWGYAISGDLPIVLLKIEDPSNIELVRQLVQAHAYWHLKGLIVDLVIWNEDHAGYRQLLHDQIIGMISAGGEANYTDQPGGIFVRPADQISEEDSILIQTVARVIISDSLNSLADQIKGKNLIRKPLPLITITKSYPSEIQPIVLSPRDDLIFYNGLGGFTPDGREYVITTIPGLVTPAPWVNVLANPNFGTVISESGMAYSWSENAHEFRLTPWHNDPVSDASGEALYLRDEESGDFWSPTPLPCRGLTPYVTRHGFGYSVFEHTEFGIRSELWVYVAIDMAIKFMVLRVYNESAYVRKISATGYVEWVLGDLRAKSAMHIITEIDQDSGAIFAYNPYNTEFSNRMAFFAVNDKNRSVTGDRVEFIGRNSSLNNPEAMKHSRLSGKVGAGLDPCGAIQVSFELAPGKEHETTFRLGMGIDKEDAKILANRFNDSSLGKNALDRVWQYWAHTLGAVNVDTPDPSLNILVNGWLLYQVIACRLWARTATYQSGGAFGFRDQLQDTMALVHTKPLLVRQHLLLCASRQFVEGDVQHWWHPPIGRGVRTHCSDDYLWLPLTTWRYVKSTGDTGILDENIPFIKGRQVNFDEDSYYDLPTCSDEKNTLYEHCVRAIMNSLKFGEHGLPFMGSGDWNDGMNLVGEKGKGESVWLGFFLYTVLFKFSEIALLHNDEAFSITCLKTANNLILNIEKNAWDGEWYKRAYFDDGYPLGSTINPECQIDSISQSWSVLSNGGSLDRSLQAMNSLNDHLVIRQNNLIKLLDPPFDKSFMNPGYIKGYVPGVRENGGQYTHAAIWASMAFAQLGKNNLAWELLSMINPINHVKTIDDTNVYKVEPYVMAADVYATPPHNGRGGWTWYTGSAAWMYQLILESLLGLKLESNKLSFNPCFPSDWESFKIHYRYRETIYHITVLKIHTKNADLQIIVDNNIQTEATITLIDDNLEHWAEVNIPSV